MQFNQPFFAYLAPIAPLVFLALGWLYYTHHQKSLVKSYGNPKTLRGFSSFGRGLRTLLFLAIALSLGFLTAAEPKKASPGKTGRTLNAVIVCDASKSMGAEDYPGGVSRREMAILSALKLIEAFPDGHFGVVYFTDEAWAYSVTDDRRALPILLEYNCDPSRVRGSGSELAQGLAEALILIHLHSEIPIKTVVLLSDGGEVGQEESLNLLAQKYQEQGIRIVTGGLGDVVPSRIPVYDSQTGEFRGFYTLKGEFALTRLNEASLKVLANLTGGAYQRIRNGEELPELIKSRGWDDQPIPKEGEESFIFFPLAGLLVVLALWLVERRFAR